MNNSIVFIGNFSFPDGMTSTIRVKDHLYYLRKFYEIKVIIYSKDYKKHIFKNI